MMSIYSVSELTGYLHNVIDQDPLLQDVWVRGEIANLARPISGNCYFTLRDAESSLRCAMFGRSSTGMDFLSNGSEVIAHGRTSVYKVRGDLQLITDMIRPEGEGELQIKFEQLLHKLDLEGLFNQSRKRDIPSHPRKIGVITSLSGSVWHDIKTVIARRYPLVELALAPVAVQGHEAKASIVDALEKLGIDPEIDIVIVARGGGSLEDLRVFNEEEIARAIFASTRPVITGIGHETDTTIADYVADIRAATPSAAAEIAVPHKTDLLDGISGLRQSLKYLTSANMVARRDTAKSLISRLEQNRPDLDGARLNTDELLRNLHVGYGHILQIGTGKVDGLRSRIGSLSPEATLKRGYAIVQNASKSMVVSNPKTVDKGDHINLTLYAGEVDAEVTATRSNRNRKPNPTKHTR